MGSGRRDAELDAAANAQVGRVVPGVAVAVADAGGAALARSFGFANLRSGREMTSASMCNWFSMTKLVTATAVVQLSDRGLLDLDAPVGGEYEPLSRLRPAHRSRRITARHLLSHSSGLANPLPLRWVHRADEPGPDRRGFVERVLARNGRVRFDPGTRASYTNLGYLVLGELIEQVTGRSFEDTVRAEVLEPLGMTSTGLVAGDHARWAVPYQRRFTTLGILMPLLVPRAILAERHGRFRAMHHFFVHGAAYGGLVGPASDAARFMRAHLGDGELDGTRILSPEATRAMQVMGAHGRSIDVGLGWFQRGKDRGGDFVEHLGGGAGFWSCLRIHPDRGLGVVTMGNSTAYDHDAIARAAINAVS